MTRKQLAIALAGALVATVGLAGCKKKEAPVVATPPAADTTPAPAPAPSAQPARILSVDLGNALGAGNRVTAPATAFATGDTIYASINTSGMPSGNKIGVKWTYQDGAVVHSESRDMQGADTIYEFHIQNPNPWPAGKYKLEVDIDGAQVETREFEVNQ
ncbi:hypothetical protein [Luteimonas sp. e5]